MLTTGNRPSPYIIPGLTIKRRNSGWQEKMRIITEVVCQYYGVSPKEIKIKKRSEALVSIRMVAAIFCIDKIEGQMVRRVAEFLNVNHSSVCYYKKRMSNIVDYENMTGKHKYTTELKEINRLLIAIPELQ